MSSAGDQSRICNIHAASKRYGCPYKSSSLPSEVCFSAPTNGEIVRWEAGKWGIEYLQGSLVILIKWSEESGVMT
jgi:hypothetical protein